MCSHLGLHEQCRHEGDRDAGEDGCHIIRSSENRIHVTGVDVSHLSSAVLLHECLRQRARGEDIRGQSRGEGREQRRSYRAE